MKQELIIKIIAKDYGSNNLIKLNELFKSKKVAQIKYRMMGKKLGHFGCTAFIKNISKDGIKVFLPNKVKLIKFEEIEIFDKPTPRSERPIHIKKEQVLIDKKDVPQKKAPAHQGSRFTPTKTK